MNLIHVIPISRSVFTDELSYFTKDEVPEGALITVPLRKKNISAIVVSSEPVKDAKVAIKTSDFQIRKITKKNERPFLQPAFIYAARRAAEYYATSVGSILFSAIPKHIRDAAEPPGLKHAASFNTKKQIEPLVLGADRAGRIEEYKNRARTAFAKKQSVIIVASTIREVEIISGALSRGIGKYLYTFHSGLSKGTLNKQWRESLASDHAIVAVMTGGFLSLPRHDIKTVILEREQSNSFKQHQRPYMDVRELASWYAGALGATLIRADQPLRVSSLYYYKNGTYDSVRDLPMRIVGGAKVSLADMCEEKPDRDNPYGFAILSEQLVEAVTRALRTEQRVFLFAARRGIAPVTVCNDCGTRVSCLECEAPVVLHKVGNDHIFVCHACGATRSAHETCKSCGSWKLQTLGVGIQLVQKELARFFPDVPITIFDRDTLTTHRQAVKSMNEFYESGSIVLGTEMTLTYLDKPMDVSGIVSLDSLLSVPEWNVYERIISIILRTREFTKSELIVQTRKPDDDVVNWAIKGDLGSFYKNELADRKEFNYPPFATLIKISCEGTVEHVQKTSRFLEETLGQFGFTSIPHMMRSKSGKHMVHGFLRLKQNRWPHQQLLEVFATFPPDIRIEVDPGSIL